MNNKEKRNIKEIVWKIQEDNLEWLKDFVHVKEKFPTSKQIDIAEGKIIIKALTTYGEQERKRERDEIKEMINKRTLSSCNSHQDGYNKALSDILKQLS